VEAVTRTSLALAFYVGAGGFFIVGELHAYASTQFGIVDCFGQPNVLAARARGVIVDPTGVPLSGALVTMTGEGGSNFETKSDSDGHWSLMAPPGHYIFRVKMDAFAGPEIGLDIHRDVTNIIRPKELKVLIGLQGMFCPWVTTNDAKFKYEIAENKKRLEESAKKNATQE